VSISFFDLDPITNLHPSDTVDEGSKAHRSRRHVLRMELEARALLHRLGSLTLTIQDEFSLSPVC
jgi:hypothetical protein